MVFLELLRMNYTEVVMDSDPFSVANISPFELLVLPFHQVGHGTFRFRDDCPRCKRMGGEDT